jgi:hypothetical protein
MIKNMLHIKCCANCKHFNEDNLECELIIDNKYKFNTRTPYFYYCAMFKVNEKDITYSKDLLGYIDDIKQARKISKDKDKLIDNMAKFISNLDIDYNICTPMLNNKKCLAEQIEEDSFNKGEDVPIENIKKICIECVKNWFSKDN